jgi:DNA-binding IclR family transcriptional regulator
MVRASYIVQGKMFRFMQVLNALSHGKYTVDEIAERLDLNRRMVYRYLNMMNDLEYGLTKDEEKRYFIPPDKCPFCKREK